MPSSSQKNLVSGKLGAIQETPFWICFSGSFITSGTHKQKAVSLLA
jgi:hypothetical protein